MAWQPTMYTLLGVGAAVVSAAVIVQVWRKRDEAGAMAFVGLLVALLGWSLASAIQFGFTTTAEQYLWQRIGIAIGGTIPPFWLLFTLGYADQQDRIGRIGRTVVFAEPIVFGGLALTNPVHGLLWSNPVLTPTGAGPVLRVTFEIGYYAHIAYAYLLIVVGLGLLIAVFLRDQVVYRTQTGLLILGTLLPFGGNIAYTLRLSWGPLPGLDPTPFAFVVTGVLFGLALFQFDLLERSPIAHRHVLEETGDGLVVLDTDGRIVDLNPIAEQILDPTPTIDASITEFDLADVDSVSGGLATLDGRTHTATVDGRERTYDVDRSKLTDERGGRVGHVITFRDVTERNNYQQRLEVTQRVLRHNLRNDMTVIKSHAHRIVEGQADDEQLEAEQIVEHSDKLIDLSDKIRTIAQIDAASDADRRSLDVREMVIDCVDEFRATHPVATIECALDGTLVAELTDERLFRIPVENVIENAIEHQGPDPWVRVEARRADDHVRVRVEDAGPEIPSVELDVLDAGTESALEHGSGMGLWLTNWSVELAGGDLTFDTGDDGNIVTMTFPAADGSSTADESSIPGDVSMPDESSIPGDVSMPDESSIPGDVSMPDESSIPGDVSVSDGSSAPDRTSVGGSSSKADGSSDVAESSGQCESPGGGESSGDESSAAGE